MSHKPWKEIKQRSKADPRAVAEERAAIERELTLAEVRRARDMTQVQLASALDLTQPGVSQMERRTDLYVSTLRSYIEALGGQLEIVAVFPDAKIALRDFAALNDDADLAAATG